MRYTNLIQLRFDELLGEGNVKYSKNFEQESMVVKLDVLQDCIEELNEKLEKLLENIYAD